MTPRAEANVQRGEQTREAVLDAAVDLFGEYGYRGTSLAQIAKQAGIVQSGLHHHFGSKENLLTAALEEHYPLTQSLLDLPGIASGSVTLGAELVRITSENVRTPHLVRFFSVLTGESLTNDHPANPFFEERYRRLRDRATDAVIAGNELPRTTEEHRQVELIMATAFGAIDGLQMQWLRDPLLDLVAGANIVAEMVDRQLAARSTR